jgi:hypothetical protein
MDNISPRLQYLIDHYGKVLSDTLFQRAGQELDIEQAVLKFAEFDPSRNKSATQWLIHF